MIRSPWAAGFTWSADNQGTTYRDGFGTLVTQGANTKYGETQALVGIAEDAYFIQVMFGQGWGAGSAYRYLTDVVIDPGAGVGGNGASWQVVIPNLAAMSPSSTVMMAGRYGFPLFIPKGSAIGFNSQNNTGGSMYMALRVFGKPQRPELLRYGHKVQALGLTVGSTVGTSFTPGTNAKGSWSASLGTLSLPSWWWQAGFLTSTASMAASSYLLDVSFDATNKYLASQDSAVVTTSSEQVGGGHFSGMLPIRDAPAGADVYIRGACLSGAPIANITGAAYALG